MPRQLYAHNSHELENPECACEYTFGLGIIKPGGIEYMLKM